MPIVAKAGATYKPAPDGSHAAVCCDVIDKGNVEVTYQGKTKSQHKIQIVWQIDELRDDGKRFTVQRRYTNSLHEKAALRKDLESWRGRAFTETELAGFDLENLLGAAALINIIHELKGGSTYANVTGIMKLPKQMTAPQIHDYIRACDRHPEDKGGASDTPEYPASDEDIPF